MKSRGFGAVEGLLIIVLLAAIGFTVWQVNQVRLTTDQGYKNSQQEQSNLSQDDNSSPLITELDEAISLAEAGDEEKLPATVPASFKDYMQALLTNNEPDELGCVDAYSVARISAVNIAGGVGDVRSDTHEIGAGCSAGGKAIWYLQAGEWQLHGYQALGLCSELAGLPIYEEFLPSCLETPESTTPAANPNGSIDNAEL